MPTRNVTPEAPADDTLDAQYIEEERALIAVQPATPAGHHIVSGMAQLAQMSDADFEATMVAIEQGQKRLREFQQRVMIKGEDYGVVKGIDRPFLHLPGAEKLTLLYGLAARQEVQRVEGRRAMITVDGITQESGEWLSPPLAFFVKTYVHVGSFDGPIVAMGTGEANSWEEKYRYRWAKAKCPNCNREGMIKGNPNGKLKGKWWCPGKEGGCNKTFEPNDPQVEKPGKIDNQDPYSLAETLVQMAAKRSFVAATRRATGTSGIFTQDEDSPSVREQAGDEPEPSDERPAVTPVEEPPAEEKPAGPRLASNEQINLLAKTSRERDLGPEKIVLVATSLGIETPDLGEGDRAAKGVILKAWLKERTADEVAGLLRAIDSVPGADEVAEPASVAGGG